MLDIKKNTALIAAIVLVIALIFAGLTARPKFQSPEVILKEAPLEKNSELMITPGEQYVYGYLYNNTTANITYSIASGGGCTLITVENSPDGRMLCLDKEGLDETGSNSTFSDPSILFFKPWMLALEESWRWNNSVYIRYDDIIQHTSDTYYKVIRSENYRGREVFVVRIDSSSGPAEYLWIDKEKRVLLKVVGEGYQVELFEGIELD